MEEFQNKSRRKFIRNISGGILAAGVGLSATKTYAKPDVIKLTILHTNDVHSHIDPFADNHPKYPGMGGVARRAALIQQIRSEEKNVLLFDAGDIFQGTPYFNLYGGELEMKLMSEMSYDAATIGNHDFDNGIDGLVRQLPHARFPLLNTNYNFSRTSMEGKSAPYKIFEKEGLKIGVFGVGIELAGLVDKRLFGNTIYLDPVAQSMKYSSYLKRHKKCDLVICLSHLGYSYENDKISDIKLAKLSENIDLIIGGHTHTFMDEPVKILNNHEQEIIVTQAGWAGLRLGRIDYLFTRISKKKISTTSTMKDLIKSSEI